MKSLDAHFPSSPTRPPKFVLYFRDLGSNRLASHGFCSLSSAKAFVDEIIRYLPEEKPKWKGSDQLVIGFLQVNSNRLEDIMESEESVSLPYPYTAFAARIAGREEMVFIAPKEEDAPARRQRKERAEAPRKKSADGSTSAADIASELGLKASVARRILRKAEVAKPYSWTDQADIDHITALLKKG